MCCILVCIYGKIFCSRSLLLLVWIHITPKILSSSSVLFYVHLLYFLVVEMYVYVFLFHFILFFVISMPIFKTFPWIFSVFPLFLLLLFLFVSQQMIFFSYFFQPRRSQTDENINIMYKKNLFLFLPKWFFFVAFFNITKYNLS